MVSYRRAGKLIGLLALTGAAGLTFSYVNSELRKEIRKEGEVVATQMGVHESQETGIRTPRKRGSRR